MEIFILDIDHQKNVVRLWGRDKNNQKICIQVPYEYYVYFLPKDEYFEEVKNTLEKLNYVKKIEIEKKKFLGKEYNAIKTYLDEKDYDKIRELAEALKAQGKIDGKKEVDIPIHKKFVIDNKIYPLSWYDFELEGLEKRGDIIYCKLKKINGRVEKEYKLKVMAFDIEVLTEKAMPDPKQDPIISIAIYSGNYKRVITWKGENNEDTIVVRNEYELLETFNRIIKELDPDVIVGYNSNNFDCWYLYERAKALNFSFTFGWDRRGFVLTKKREEKRFRIVGIQHVDLYETIVNLFAGQLKSETYTLDEVAKEILGYGKEDMTMERMYKLWKKEKVEEIVKYNLRDAEITYKLFKHFENVLIELSRVTGLTLYEVSNATYGQLVESYLMKRSRDFNEIIPNRPKSEDVERRRTITYKGAFVLEPKPGLYENIVVYDFRSLYPSIIIRYNISFDTLKCEHEECKKENSIEIETSLGRSIVWFCTKKQGMLPSILKEIFEERARLKKKLKQLDPSSEEYVITNARQYALKILANSMYGYLGFPNSRWYCLECAAAVTALGRKHIQEIIKLATEKGFKPIYGDTDSIFILVSDKESALEFLEEINRVLPKPLELEFEDFYIRGIFVAKRSGEAGAKKKYALLSESGKIKLRGFEVVRRDWAPIAKETQEKVIDIILREGDTNKVIQFLRKVIQKVKNKEFPLEKFIIKEQLRKKLEEYKVDAPHVVAAKKYKKLGYDVRPGFIVEYIVCQGGEKISDKVRLPEECKDKEYDPNYYIDRQIFPAIESILNAIKLTKEQIIAPQKTILDFFRK